MKLKSIGLIVLLLRSSVSVAQVSFDDVSQQLGVNVICGNTYLGNGITFFDYDNDGLDDITVGTTQGDPVRFFKNINGLYVEQILNISNNDGSNRQINWVDIDNDRDNDLFITSDTDGVRLFENLGNMILQEITSSSGMLTDVFPYYGASWGDYNNDGYLDVFISVRDITIPSILYKNNGDNTFTLANLEAGLTDQGMMSFCSAFLDYDNDGDQDIYVSNDKPAIPNLLYRNNGDGTFTEVGQSTGTDIYIDAMTVTVDDLNNDGWLDIYVTNDDSDSVLLMNNADGTFTDMAQSYGVTFNSNGWGALFLDADNDMDLDLYVSGDTNGSLPQFLSSAFYENNGDGTFQLNNSAIPNDFSFSYSNALGDTDNDGYPEFVVNHINQNNISVWKNESADSNNWLKIKLQGSVSNKNGIGSFIEVSVNGEKQYRYTLLGEGYLSQNSATEIVGLGSHTMVDYVKVKWLSGVEDIIYNVTPNQTLNILEGSTLSIQENTLLSLNYYPNPVRHSLKLRARSNISSVLLLNLLGQQIKEIRPNSIDCKLDMSEVPSGYYLLKVSIGSTTQTVRITKQ